MSKTPLVTFISRVRIRSDSNSATTREEVEPQSADRVRGVVDRSTQAQSDVPGGSSAISRASGSLSVRWSAAMWLCTSEP